MAVRRPYSEGGYEDQMMGGPYDQAPMAPEAAPSADPFYAARLAVEAHPETNPSGGVEQQFRNLWNAYPDHNADSLAQMAGSFGLQTEGDTILFPDKKIDALMDEGGLNNPGWIQVGAPGGISSGSRGVGGRGGGGGGSASSSSSKVPQFGDMNGLMEVLKGLFPGGLFNQDIVNRRTENASEALNRQRKSRLATNRAALADRGLIGDGPEASMMGSLEDDLYSQFTNATSGIYADESENADSRMMQAMQLAAGLTTEEAQQLIEWFQAHTQRQLGEGQLALGNKQADNDYRLGQGTLDLGRDRLDFDSDSDYWDWLLRNNQQGLEGAEVTTRGYR